MKKYLLTLLVALSIARIANAQVYYIKTFAGTGTIGYTGDNGQATAAEFNNPIHSCPDNKGNIYIADNINHVIRKVDAAGVVTTVAGNGTMGNNGDAGQATLAELNTPADMAVDDTGNLYICDRGACVIRKVKPSGIISTICGTGGPGFSGDGGAATSAKLGEPRGIAVDDSGNILIADFANSCVRKINKSGVINTIAGMGYVFGYTGDGGQATDAKLNYAAQLAVDDSENIYIADYQNNVIRKVNNKGIISTFAGNGTGGYLGDSVAATTAELNGPLGVAVDKQGNVYIADYLSQRIRKVNKSGTIITIAGTGALGHTGDGGLALSGELQYAAGVNVDANGNVYVSELASPGNNDIRELYLSCNSTFILNPLVPPVLCPGQSTVLSASGSDTGYTWSPSQSLSNSTGDTVTATPSVTTTYVVVGSAQGGCTSSDTIVISVGIAPNKPIVGISGDTLISSATQGNQWYLNDTLIPGATNQKYVITGNKKGFYTVTVINPANGCTSSSDPTTGINQLPVIFSQLSIYPNPFSNDLFVKINSSVSDLADWALRVTDELGRTVVNKSSLNYMNEIDLSNLPNGVYFITVINKTQQAVLPVVKGN